MKPRPSHDHFLSSPILLLITVSHLLLLLNLPLRAIAAPVSASDAGKNQFIELADPRARSAGNKKVTFELSSYIRESKTDAASKDKPKRIDTKVIARALNEEGEEDPTVEMKFDIDQVIPPEERKHFDVKSQGKQMAFLYVVKPLDREELAKKYSERVSNNGDVEIVLDISAAYGDTVQTIRFTVTVEDVNDVTPVFEEKALEKNLDENADPNSVNPLMHVRATDDDHGVNGKVTYRRETVTSVDVKGNEDVKTDPGSWFKVESGNGAISVQKRIDREKTTKFYIVVVATDGGSPTREATSTATVNINDVNDNKPVCSFKTCDVKEDHDKGKAIDSCDIICEDKDEEQSAANVFTLSAAEGHTCPFELKNFHVLLMKELDREKAAKHECIVTAKDPGKKDFKSLSELVVAVKDVNDNFPRPKHGSPKMEKNEVKATFVIEFIDEDENNEYYDVTMTKGGEYFNVVEPSLPNRVARAAAAADVDVAIPKMYQLSADNAILQLLQTQVLPNDFEGLAFHGCDSGGICGNSDVLPNFPLKRTEQKGGFDWWIIIIVALVLFIIIIFIVVMFIKKKKAEVEKGDGRENGHKPKEGVENVSPEQSILLCDSEFDDQKPVSVNIAIFSKKEPLIDPSVATSIDEKKPPIEPPLVATIVDVIHKQRTNLEEAKEKNLQFGKLAKMLGEVGEAEKEIDKVEDNFLPTQEEDSYYLRCFKACDKNNSGHLTTTELLKVLEWMNENPFGEQKPRVVNMNYVEGLRRKYDIDTSYTFDFPEFINLMKGEKIAFAEQLFKEANKSGQEKAVDIDLKKGTAIFSKKEPLIDPSVTMMINEKEPAIEQPVVATIVDAIHKQREIHELEEGKEKKEPDCNDELLESFIDEDKDLTNIAKWGPRFGKLAKMLGEVGEAEKEIDEVEDNFLPTQEEDSYYLRCFKACDENNSGHLTTTELLKVLEWMNENPFGKQKPRIIDMNYVEGLRHKYDIDTSYTFDFPEFINLMKGEKIAFAEKLFKEADKNGQEKPVDIDLKKGMASFSEKEPLIDLSVAMMIDEEKLPIEPQVVATIVDAIHKQREIGNLEESEEKKEPDCNDELLESFVDEDEDFTNIAKWGLRFGKLTKMLGEVGEAEKKIDEVEDNFLPTQEEDSYYLRCFKACDENNSGHLTTTELLKVLEWMNANPFGKQKPRIIDMNYVEGLRHKYDIDTSYTFDFPEFINLMKGEKIAFTEQLFKEADKNSQEKPVNIDLKKGMAIFSEKEPLIDLSMAMMIDEEKPPIEPQVVATIVDAIHKQREIGNLEESKEKKEPDYNDELLESFVDEDEDFTNDAKWGPRFGKLTKMHGEVGEVEKEIDEVKDNFLPTQEEDLYYLRCFKACDENNSGHVTTTELLKALEWMNENPFGEQKPRVVDLIYVEGLRHKYDIDTSYTFNFPEFINLMKGEKIAFAEQLFKEADKNGQGKLRKNIVEAVLKDAGYVFKGTWAKFLDKYDKNNDNYIDYAEFITALKECTGKVVKA